MLAFCSRKFLLKELKGDAGQVEDILREAGEAVEMFRMAMAP